MTASPALASPTCDVNASVTVRRGGAYSTTMHKPVTTLSARRALVAGRERSRCYITIRNGLIDAVTQHKPQGSEEVELGSLDLIPGVIDLHGDSLNSRRQPRTGARFPLGPTLLQADTEGISNGVTTQCLCVTVDEDLTKWGDIEDPLKWLHALQRQRQSLRTDSYLHVRFELTTAVTTPHADLLDNDYTRVVSYMVHAPGVGQYTHDPAAWHKLYLRSHPGPSEDRQRLASERLARANDVTDARRRVADAARAAGIALASHDDITPADAVAAANVGASIAEFPLTMDAATHAKSLGLGVIVGAPNAWQGRSHLAWLSARTAVRAGVVDALVSDYHPSSMLQAAYALAQDECASWAEALNLVTQGPARLADFTDRGQIAEGLSADLAAVDMSAGTPVVRQAWRNGALRLGLP